MKRLLFFLIFSAGQLFAQVPDATIPDPLLLASLKMWFRSDVVVKDTANLVNVWPDLGANNRGLVASAPRLPLWVDQAVNGHPAVVFDGIDDAMFLYPVLNLRKNTILIVYREVTSVNGDGILSWRNHFAAGIDEGNDPANIGGANDDNGSNSYSFSQGRQRGIRYRGQGASGHPRYFKDRFKVVTLGYWNKIFHRVNGELLQEEDAIEGDCHLNAFVLSARSTAGGGVNGWANNAIAEIMVFDSVMTLAQLESLEGAMLQKYGMTAAGTLALQKVRRSFQHHDRVTVKFNKPVAAASAVNTANYRINQGVNVLSAQMGSQPDTVLLETSPLSDDPPGYELWVDGILDLEGKPSQITNSIRTIETGRHLPADIGQPVNGFVDDFTSNIKHSDWVAVGPAGDVYRPYHGILQVGSGSGTQNHLLYNPSSPYDGKDQEVLARIRVQRFEGEGARGGVSVVVNSTDSSGVNFVLKNGSPNRVLLESDSFRPGLSVPEAWDPKAWYWLRLKTSAGSAPKARIWKSDFDAEEPATWQELPAEKYAPTAAGLAGIQAGEGGVPSEFELDWILIKAPRLSTVVPEAPAAPGVVLSILPRDGKIVLRWPKETGLGYSLQMNETFDPMNWGDGPGAFEAGEFLEVELDLPGVDAPPQFFRLIKPL